MRNGRPLRFLLLTLSGWTALRTVMLWPAATPSGGAESTSPPVVVTRIRQRFDPVAWLRAPVNHPPIDPWPLALTRAVIEPRRTTAPARPRDGSDLALALTALVRFGPPMPAPGARPTQEAGAITPPLRPTPIAATRSRLAGSAWLIARGGGDAPPGSVLGGQLGASQAGARITYALGEARRFALSARVATPLNGDGHEAAFGLDWQPTRAPLHLIAEQRVSLDGGSGGPTLLAVAGLNPAPIAAGFRLEAYAQAGAIARAGGVEGFGDGAARLTRPVASVGALRLDLGAGAWGAVQRGARRLDIGPTIGLVAPLGGQAVRLTLDWRERIAGDARPDSGPALSLGTDF